MFLQVPRRLSHKEWMEYVQQASQPKGSLKDKYMVLLVDRLKKIGRDRYAK